jgi:Protein of unknown function (DUF2934)
MADELTEDHAEADEHQIRERASQLWQADGAPEGKSDHYWQLARKLLFGGD